MELFLPSSRVISPGQLGRKLQDSNLILSALGTGGGFLKYGWSLCSSERSVRNKAFGFILDLMEFGAELRAPVIIGSMKGSAAQGEDRDSVLATLTSQLSRLTERAAEIDAQILLEPLNRYETNLVNTLSEGSAILESVASDRLRLLADLFHMNIEEVSIRKALL